MCGIAGEIRLDGGTPTSRPSPASPRPCTAAARTAPACTPLGPIALGHRRLKIIDLSERGGQPMVDAELGLAAVFNGCIYNYRELRAELEGAGYRFFSTSDTEVLLKAFHRWGAACVERFFGMFAFAVAERDTGVLTLGRDRLGHQAALPRRDPEPACGSPSALPALLEGGEVDTSIDRVALHHYMTLPLGRPGAAHDPRGRAQAPARHRAHDPARRHRRPTTSTGAPSTCAAREYAGHERARLARRRARGAAAGGAPPHGRRRARRRAALRRPRLVAGRGACSREEGQVGLKTFSVGFHATAGESGDEFEYSDLVAERVRHRPPADPRRPRPACCPPSTRRSRRWPSRWSATTAWPSTCSPRRSRSRSRSCSPGRARTRCSRATAGTRRWPRCRARRRRAEYAQVFTDRPHAELAHILEPEWLLADDPSRAFVAEHFAMPGADRRRWTPRCGWTRRSCWWTTRSSGSTT